MNPMREALQCLMLGLRSSLQFKAAFYSLGVWLFAIVLWAIAFYFGWSYVAPHLAPDGWPGWLQTLLRALGGSILFVALVFLTMRLLVDFWLIEIINTQVEKTYPHMPRVPQPPIWTAVRLLNIARPWGWLWLAPLFLIPVVGAFLFLVLMSFISVNALLPDTFSRILPAEQVRDYARRDRKLLLWLAVLLSLLLLIPFNFLMPWILGSTMCHYSQRAVRKQQV